MKLLKMLAILCSMFACGAPPAAAQTAAEQRQLDWALERGRLLFALDRAAWVGTDDMKEHIRDPRSAGLRGYIVDRDEQGFVAIFFAREGERLVAAYRGRVGGSGIASREVFPAGQRPELTPRQQRIARTLEQLRTASPNLEMCSPASANVAIIPPESAEGPVDVYVMTPQTETNVIPFGGHHRLTLDPQGRILNQRRFTKTCLAIPLSRPGNANRPAGLVVSHLLDRIPTEIHVFNAMAARLPVYVSAGGSVWEVSGERIRFVSRVEETR
jgi:hypothetical protein